MNKIVAARYGFNEPRSRHVSRPDDPLYRLFVSWINMVSMERIIANNSMGPIGALYEDLEAKMRNVPGIAEKDTMEVEAVVLTHQTDKRVSGAGLFLSAFYNISGRDLIEYTLDSDIELDLVGYRLGQGKTLALKSDTGELTGAESKGRIENHAYSKAISRASGIVVNHCDVGFIELDSEGQAWNLGEARSFVGKNLLNHGEIRLIKTSVNDGTIVNHGKIVEIEGYPFEMDFIRDRIDRPVVLNFNHIEKAKDSILLVNHGSVGYNSSGCFNFGSIGSLRQDLVAGYGSVGKLNPRNAVLVIPKGDDYHGLRFETIAAPAEIKADIDMVKHISERYSESGFPECFGAGKEVLAALNTGKGFKAKIKGFYDQRKEWEDNPED